ncbi:MAG: hypothetical protein K8U03_15625 [Planctomycetia bacterium]|nr:hypothetical protein [Planctomycetia bacterium]
MKTRLGSLVVVAATILSSGCTMCCPSYDYCSPTNPGESNSELCGKERRGSVFSGYTTSGEQVVPGETIMESPQAPAVPQPVAEPQPTNKPTSFSRNASKTVNSARRNR